MAATAARKDSVAKPQERDHTFTRFIDAPRERVFKAWIDPHDLALWWGPRGFTNPVCELDTRPGGLIRIDMQGPNGVLEPMKGIYHELSEPARIVFTSTAFEDEEEEPQLQVLTTVLFIGHMGRTRVSVTATVVKASPAVTDAIAGMEEGWTQSLDRLAELLERPAVA
ncbi:MAG: SRPBCC family protein [Nitrospirota bacterium]